MLVDSCNILERKNFGLGGGPVVTCMVAGFPSDVTLIYLIVTSSYYQGDTYCAGVQALSNNAAAHAEINLLYAAGERLGTNDLSDYIFVSNAASWPGNTR